MANQKEQAAAIDQTEEEFLELLGTMPPAIRRIFERQQETETYRDIEDDDI